MTSLEKLIAKNSRLKKDYLTPKGKSKVADLDRDAGRSAKPIGFRFRGKHDYRKPTPTEVTKGLKRGTVYKEARPNRGDVFPKGYRGSISGLKKKKLEEGGMADGMEMKKGGMSPQKKAANHGASWTLDHNQHNKNQSYEIQMRNRKRK